MLPQIHFDGWSHVYDFWIDADHPDIHPMGWCSKTGHPLQPPLSKCCTCVSSSSQGTSMPDPTVTATCPCTEMGGQVLAEDGQGGKAIPGICQLEKSSLFGAGRQPRALALPRLAAVTAFLLFLSSGCRAKGTSLLCPWGLPKPGLQEHPSLQELQVQLSPQVSSSARPRGAQLLPCWAGPALPLLLLTCHPHQHPALPCTHPTPGSVPCSPRPGPGAAPGPQLE